VLSGSSARRQESALEVIWNLLVFLALVAVGLVVLAYWLGRAELAGAA
jgi:hypothetical protein